MKPHKLNRRDFLRRSAKGTLGFGIGLSRLSRDNEVFQNYPSIKEYRKLGRTGFLVSDIGSGIPYSEAVLKAVIDSGVNFIETSESYDNGRNEILIGKTIKNLNREKLFIATKLNISLGITMSQDEIYTRAEESRKRLGSGYIDLYMMHQAQSILKVSDRNFHRACDRLRKEGKIRFVGLSCHGSFWWQEQGGSLEDILIAAIEDGRYDVLFFPYNFLDPGMGERILARCKAANIGTMIMKSNPVGILESYESVLKRGDELGFLEQKDYETKKIQMEKAGNFFRKYGMTGTEDLKRGAYRFILSNDNVSTICCRFRNFSDIDMYVGLSGSRLNEKENLLLAEFRESLGFLNCRIGCNKCEKSCPVHLPVSTIMRYYYYSQALSEQETASSLYRNIGNNESGICRKCQGHCEKACPHNVAIRFLLADAHRQLSKIT
ncbi:MAG TPA: hypothetical protein DDW27_00460 [Bacteroidales bacterium]|jgi:predicted aldo/keto reductase-like oxidoreductase|nr:hypothetical protein [Bacteroidales bacterium]